MTVTLRWLGQAGFILSSDATSVAIDPFLSAHPDRIYDAAITPDQLACVDAVLCTHEHADHLDLPALVAAARFGDFDVLVPRPVTDIAVSGGLSASRVGGVVPGDVLAIGAARVWPVPALHGVHIGDAYGFGREPEVAGPRFCGYLIDLGGVRVFHAGDTLVYPGLAEFLRNARVDVALLPINGRDAQREARDVVGNLDAAEACELAGEARIPMLVPMHHDCMRGNTADPGEVLRRIREQPGREQPGVTVLLPGREADITLGAARASEERAAPSEVEAAALLRAARRELAG